jgi:hypothetical protein
MEYIDRYKTITLAHPFAGPSPLPLHGLLRSYQPTPAERKLIDSSTAEIAALEEQAERYAADRMGAELAEAKRQIAKNITPEALEEIARLTALAADPATARRVAEETSAAVRPAIAAADAKMIPICEKIISSTRQSFAAATAGVADSTEKIRGLMDDEIIDAVLGHVAERIQATHQQMDAWAQQAATGGALAFLRDHCSMIGSAGG